jgi:energy-converting hydrogenase Eha subunit C
MKSSPRSIDRSKFYTLQTNLMKKIILLALVSTGFLGIATGYMVRFVSRN